MYTCMFKYSSLNIIIIIIIAIIILKWIIITWS